jgi:hypothetical protein
MDTDQLIAHGRARFEHAAARRLLKERYQAKMIFAYSGGMWRAGPELLCTLSCCHESHAVLLDLYDQPIKVDVRALTDLVQQRWREQMTAWLLEYETVNTKR